ncbi:hypothetical protein ACFVMC_31590 [Nocardia sp. NPDC127579]|uniref:hypothetical protein n=1 Tax=Nocardia sp. NPDC127579 TaxID=3345402 RepID=UPI003645DDCC
MSITSIVESSMIEFWHVLVETAAPWARQLVAWNSSGGATSGVAVAYELSALIGDMTMLAAIGSEHEVPVVPLASGLALIPLTDDIAAVLFAGKRFEEVLRAWSAHGPLIYAWSEMHAGLGVQAATIWEDGAVTYHETGYPGRGPISIALHRLGVTGAAGRRDEFEVVGLNRHRRTGEWVPS